MQNIEKDGKQESSLCIRGSLKIALVMQLIKFNLIIKL